MPKVRDIQPGHVFNNYTVLGPAPKTPGRRERRFKCLCSCGNTTVVYLDLLGKTETCSKCKYGYDHLYRKYPELTRKMSRHHSYELWSNMLCWEKRYGVPVCDEWRDFKVFLEFYLERTGMQLYDVLKGRVGLSYYRAWRVDKGVGWQPDNVIFERFVTERARHKPTWAYWHTLKKRDLLDESVLVYKDFVNAFGTKDGTLTLARKDILKKHSKDNSHWVVRPRVPKAKRPING